MAVYELGVEIDFIARHFLIAGNGGPENRVHSHHYRLEIQLQGNTLDDHGYLVDIVKVREHLERLVDGYRGQTLNELPELQGLNPSIENLARVSCRSLWQFFRDMGIRVIRVRVWEDGTAWAGYQEE